MMGMRLSSFISDTLLYLCSIWCIVWILSKAAPNYQIERNIPRQLTADVSYYPNPLGISRTHQILTSANVKKSSYHPVVLFPLISSSDIDGEHLIPNYHVLDCTQESGLDRIIPKEEQARFRKDRKKGKLQPNFSVGRYDENRPMMYSSEMFMKEKNPRTVHIGIDIGGPVGTKVYAFADGVVEHIGYNDALGDYGHVVVVRHDLLNVNNGATHVWALYGHLDARSTNGKRRGRKVKRGQVLGRMGDVHENGGWSDPHVHFQLSVVSPDTHDMPGVVAIRDRSWALSQYPDPRIILGPLY